MDEQKLIEQCQNGDREAFRAMVKNYQRMVFSIAFRMLCDEDRAKDIVQETFIRIWLNIGRFERGRNFKTWIYTITVRLCLDEMEKNSRCTRLKDGDTEVARHYIHELTPEKNLENKDLAAVIRLLTEKLSPKQRMVFTLVCLENLDTKEVETITDMDANKIKSNLYVARKTIKEQLRWVL